MSYSDDDKLFRNLLAIIFAIASIIIGTYAIRYGWNEIFSHWLEVKRQMTWWNAFLLQVIMGTMFGGGNHYKDDGSTALARSVAMLFRYGILWIILWLVAN